MSRIHPSSENKSGSHRGDHEDPLPVTVCSSPKYVTLTVWKRSSMSFQGTDGFTVYDHKGRLSFRVDNYSRNSLVRNSLSCSSLADNAGDALVLMDGYGKPLLTLKPQIFSIQNQWNGCVYEEYNNGSSKSDKRIFSIRKPSSSMLVFGRTRNQQAQCEAEVFLNHPDRKLSREPDYRIEGSFWNRNCKIWNIASGEVAAKIMRKRTSTTALISGNTNTNSTIMLSEEVFSLVVKQGFDPQMIMAFVVILDRICFKPFFTPLMCS
ncbi:tubby C-terminal-like domain-containing protein [Artemisia annua]|uniref:Tubby C-terminal-like domain-containing protein n=1 Tax=Artemisia annua TaxID=35608 RepID=A0A2U1N5B5_ARTAN|nr:tubby C-terminal-like domain-containing protein [Artemisia annua]